MTTSTTLRLAVAWMILSLSTGCAAPAAAPTATLPALSAEHPRVVVVDTDMAADDWMAILYLLQRPDVTLAALTVTGAGEAHCAPGIAHALGLLALAGNTTTPVACGRETPLQGAHAFPTAWRDRVDDLLGLALPVSDQSPSNQTATELLTAAVRSAPEKITLLTLGPLTNVAEALQKDPSLVDRIGGIIIMGGAMQVPGNVGASGVEIDNAVAEWNIYVDPAAANSVLRAGVPVTLVPLDATNHVPLTRKFYDHLERNHTTPEATFVYDVLTAQRAFIDSGGYSFWDPLAAAILMDESLATYQDANICVVEADGPESGWTKEGARCPEIRVALSADRERFERIFVEVLNLAAP